MKSTLAYIELLEVNITKLIDKQKILKTDNEDLKQELTTASNQQKVLNDEISRLQRENQTLKNANAILGSTEYKRETKLKINSLIKEIDQCIVQLAE